MHQKSASSWLVTKINLGFYSRNKFEKLVHLVDFITRNLNVIIYVLDALGHLSVSSLVY